MSEPGMQAVWTPAVHVESAVHTGHGAFPEVEKVVPATHSTWHTVSAVLVQAVLTPAVHVESAVHTVHGAFPEAEKDVSATHAYKERRGITKEKEWMSNGVLEVHGSRTAVYVIHLHMF
jgi:hypothetical protein